MKRFSHVLYCYDSAIDQTNAIKHALNVARSNQARLTVIDTIPKFSEGSRMLPDGLVSSQLGDWVKKERLKAFEDLLAPFDTSMLQVNFLVVEGEKKFIETIRAASKQSVDLVIKPAENPDWLERLFGSEDMHLLRKCPCPVWLMKDTTLKYKRILACVDFDMEHDVDGPENRLNEKILSMAFATALSCDADLHVAHVWDSPEADFVTAWAQDPKKAETELDEYAQSQHRSMFTALMKTFQQQVGKQTFEHVDPKIHLLQGRANRDIPKLAEEKDIDLVVMGTVARTGLPGLIIGNTAEEIIDQLHCSLLAIKPEGFVSPVLADD